MLLQRRQKGVPPGAAGRGGSSLPVGLGAHPGSGALPPSRAADGGQLRSQKFDNSLTAVFDKLWTGHSRTSLPLGHPVQAGSAETTYSTSKVALAARRRHKQQQSSTGACGPLAIPLQPLPPQPTSLPTCSPADTPHCPPHPASCLSATICCVDKRGAREGPRGKMRGRQARDMAGLGQRTGVGGRARCISNCGGCQSCHVARGRRVPRGSTESFWPCC